MTPVPFHDSVPRAAWDSYWPRVLRLPEPWRNQVRPLDGPVPDFAPTTGLTETTTIATLWYRYQTRYRTICQSVTPPRQGAQ